MYKKMMIFAMLLAFLTVSTYAFAAEVYVTQKGKKYHVENCRLIKNRETSAIEEDKAVEQGYEPCKICHKKESKEINEKE